MNRRLMASAAQTHSRKRYGASGVVARHSGVTVRKNVFLHVVAWTFLLLLFVCLYQDYLSLHTLTHASHTDPVQVYNMDLDPLEEASRSTSTSSGFYEWNVTAHSVRIGAVHLIVTSAFLDLRFGERQIRIVGLENLDLQQDSITGGRFSFQCSFEDYPSALTAANRRQITTNGSESTYWAVLYHCPAPSRSVRTVTLTVLDNTPTGYTRSASLDLDLTRVGGVDRPTPGADLGVCIAAARGKSIAYTKLVEWVEHHKLIGVDFFAFYDNGLEGSLALRLLQFYRDTNWITPVKYPIWNALETSNKHQSGVERRKLEKALAQEVGLASLNDCLYRFQNAARFMILAELDDFFLPSREESFSFLLKRANAAFPNASGFSFPTGWFFRDFNRDNILNTPQASDSFFNYMGQKRTRVTLEKSRSVVRLLSAVAVNWRSVVSVHSASHATEPAVVSDYREAGYVLHFGDWCEETFDRYQCALMKAGIEEDKVFRKYVKKLSDKVDRVKKLARVS